MLEVRMPKFDTDDIGKPGKPPKYRPFPWRLWLFAIVMAAGAGAGGYYTWQYRQKANTTGDERDACSAELGKANTEVGKKAECLSSLAAAANKNKELETQLATLSG